jgi:hypothetical protein
MVPRLARCVVCSDYTEQFIAQFMGSLYVRVHVHRRCLTPPVSHTLTRMVNFWTAELSREVEVRIADVLAEAGA